MNQDAQSIVRDAQTMLQDPDGTRWPASELVQFLNLAQREVHAARPDTSSAVAPFPLAPGVLQNLPPGAVLIDIAANASGEPITKVDPVLLDASAGNWRSRAGSRVVRHFMYDPRTPRHFRVFPPALEGAVVEMEYATPPADVAPPTGDGRGHETVVGGTSFRPQWAPVLLWLILHYAYAKDAEYGGNAALSAAYLQRAKALLATEVQSSAAVAPTS